MNLGKKLSLGVLALGLSAGTFSLGAAGCGSTSSQQRAADQSCGAGSCGGEKKKTDGGEKSCGANSCG